MSRKKGVGKFDYAATDTIQAVARAMHGDDWGAYFYVDKMRFLFDMDAENHSDPSARQSFDVESSRIIWALKEAIRNKDGTWFHKLAFAVENPQKFMAAKTMVDQLRAMLLLWCFNFDGSSKWTPTIGELKKRLNAKGLKHDERHLRRVCEEMKIKLREAKVGRPKVNSDNSRDLKP